MLNLCVLNLIKEMDSLELMMELDIYYYLEVKNIKEGDYCCVISRISKSEAVNLWQNIHLTEKSETSENIQFIITYKNG